MNTEQQLAAMTAGCRSEMQAKESYLTELNEVAAQRDELAALLREVTEKTLMPPPYGWADRVKAALAKI